MKSMMKMGKKHLGSIQSDYVEKLIKTKKINLERKKLINT